MHPTCSTMKDVPVLSLLLVLHVRLSRSCVEEERLLVCQEIPPAFSPGFTSLVLLLKDVGEINSTVLRSDNLTSVTRLRISNAGVTGVAAGAFSSFQNLLSLSLEQNLLTDVNSSWFSQTARLSELSLTGNQIEVLNESMLDGLWNLSKLILNKNRITTIDPNSFSFQTHLEELDLSENRMTWVSPQVFRSLRSTRVKLEGNPWDCSCKAADFISLLKDMWSRSLLQGDVTCETPLSLRGQAVWNVSVCVTTPSQELMSLTQTIHPNLTKAPATAPVATVVTNPPSQTPSRTKTSSNGLKPTDGEGGGLVTETKVTTPSQHSHSVINILISVIVVLCALLVVVCVLAVLQRKKHNNKTVMPGTEKEETIEVKDGQQCLTRPASSDLTENGNREDFEGWRRSCTAGRAKSANAMLFTSPFSVSGNKQMTLQTETEAKSKENASEGEKERGGDEAAAENITGVTKETKDKHASCRDEDAPYLSIGTNQSEPKPDDVDEQSLGGQRSRMGKPLGRISTWPPTAVQWRARCALKDQDDETTDVWTQDETLKLPDEGKTELNTVENHLDCVKQGDEAEETQREDTTVSKIPQFSEPESESPAVNCEALNQSVMRPEEVLKEETVLDSATDTQTSEPPKLNLEQLEQNQILEPAENLKTSNKGKPKREMKRNVTKQSGKKAVNSSTGSKAPSGGASPDDDSLLLGNEYVSMDLLHEVVQNNGRWTRERWKQIHVNKQRPSQQGRQ